jgi:GntP family gluconate:H+ symporter
MSPLAILIVALSVVVGGVLAFRLHAFVCLIVGALVVAALTPAASILRHELRKDEVRIESVSPDGRSATLADRKKQLVDDSAYEVHRVADGAEPVKIAQGHVSIVLEQERRTATLRVTGTQEGRRLEPGDRVVWPAAAKAAVKSSGATIGQRVAEGFGRTALDIGILIAMASILGSCLMAARGAERIVVSIQNVIGRGRTPLAFLAGGFLLGIPMFAEAVFYLLLPLAKAMWLGTRRHYVLYVLAIVAGATMTHSLVPPTPGPLFVAGELGVDIATMMLVGSIVGAAAAVCGFGYALWADRRWPIPLRQAAGLNDQETSAVQAVERGALPPLTMSLLPILLPVILISADSAIESLKFDLPLWARQAIRVAGDKNMALTISAGMAIALLVSRKRGQAGEIRRIIREAIVEAGEIILIIAAGGALGHALRQAGMAELVGAAMPEWKLAMLPIAWGVTAVIRMAQGSATVAMITAVGIVGPVALAGDPGFHPVYLAVAIGCGSKIGMWMNDSGFWVISKMSGLTEGETLKTASIMVFIEGCAGLAATMALATIWPMN